ncbi:MAG TPA: endonuclease, partial [Rubricoccaceae bacterium]
MLRSATFVLAAVCAAAGLAACAGDTSGPPPGPAAPSTEDASGGAFTRVEAQSVWPGLDGAELIAALRTDYTPERTLGYDRARDLLFAHDMRTAGHLRDPYTGFELALPEGADPSTAAYELGINTEHVWPQSKGARDEPLRSDLHHLFPVRDEVNSSRGNLPYGEIPDDRAEAWVTLDVSQSRPPTSNRERWSERGIGRWEPREDSKGDVARAVFYVYTLYGPSTTDEGGDAFFSTMRADLLAWNRTDPPDAAETARSAWIATQQGTPNPFVLDP